MMNYQQAIKSGVWKPLGNTGVGITRDGTIMTFHSFKWMQAWLNERNAEYDRIARESK